MSIFQWR